MPSESLFLILQITEKCNLGCPYCYLSEKSGVDMSLETAYRTIDFFGRFLKRKNYKHITICFHGGEPTLSFGLVKKIVKYAKNSAGIDTFVIGTNAVNVNKEMIRFFMSNNISPTVSMDGIAQAQDINRPFPDGRSSWGQVDKVLDLLGEHIQFWVDKRVPDPLRIRLTLTPETMGFLGESVRYLANKSVGRGAFITLMPAMGPHNRWDTLFKKGILPSALDKEMQKIADFFVERIRNNNPFNLCINECLYSKSSNFTDNLREPHKLNKAPFCGAGTKIMGVSMDGRIYPCYLFAANPQSRESRAFCMGDIFGGITRPGVVSKFCGLKQNNAFSCLYWNYTENRDPNAPAMIYSALYQSWLKALKRVSKCIKNLSYG